MIDLEGKTVLVTGGSRGIGAAIARAVGGAGATVLLHYGRSEAAARAVAEAIGGGRCQLLRADLAEPGSADALWKDARERAGRIDVLINNAGIFKPAPVETPPEAWRAAWERVLQVNLLSPADLCRHAILDFRRWGGGKIINVASRAAFRGEAPDQMPYGASKGALVTLTKTIARGFAKDGVLAFAIAPGFTGTDMVADHVDAETLRGVIADIPLGEMAAPEEIGALAAFLSSDHARHLTGATFDVNGASYVR
jgi:NAD(P)-dependent dehydrogenase (short-subunit alcohol dehydrogenase family)